MSSAASKAPVRNTALFRVPYCNAEVVEFKDGEDGEQVTNTIPAEEAFMNNFLTNFLEKYAAFYINYCKFKEAVEIVTLYPDAAVMEELYELKQAHKQYVQWKHDRDLSR